MSVTPMDDIAFERVQIEHTELSTRANTLEQFISRNVLFISLDEVEQADLREQYHLMREYQKVLERRISRQIEVRKG